LARLQIRWDSTSSIAPQAASTGDAQAIAATRSLATADLPMVIYVTAEDETSGAARKLEDISFKDERVAIGAKFFRCVKISASAAAEDRLLKVNGKTTPRLIFMKRNYDVVGVLEGRKLSASKINKAMAKLCSSEYKSKYGTMLSNYAKLLNQLDRLDDERTKLAADAKRLTDSKKKSASKQKKYDKAKAEFDKKMKAWSASETKVLELKVKQQKRPAAA
jgi:hypothetical protein